MYPYSSVVKAVALRTKQFIDGDSAARETAYAAAFAAGVVDGVDLPLTALKNDVLSVGREIAGMVANSNNPNFRRHLASQSANTADNTAVPSADASGVEWLGAFDSIFDASDNHPLEMQPEQVVLNRLENPNGFFKRPSYIYCYIGSKIRHTRTNVVFRGCVWDQSAQSTAYDGAGNCPLPQELQVLHICKVLEQIAQDGWFVPEAQAYGALVNSKQREIIEGKISLMEMPVTPRPER